MLSARHCANQCPIVVHRPLPPDARITWVRVQRRRIGTRFRWEALITLEAESLRPVQRLPSVTAAVDIGWRRVDGGLRIATVRGEDGQTDAVILPMRLVERLDHAASLRSIRDRRTDEMRPILADWLRTHEVPEWLRRETAHVAQWRGGHRFTRLGYRWAERRFDGDAEAFELLDEWRRQERHLYQWEQSERDRAQLARRELYRVAAARIAERFPRIVLAELDLRETAKHTPLELGEDARAARVYRFEAAAGEFRDALTQAVTSRGGTVEIRQVLARACHACGGLCSWNAEVYEHHTCEHCGILWHADENQCRKLLAAVASGEAA
jgi:hypothetical protein